jgi:hypothetical protein
MTTLDRLTNAAKEVLLVEWDPIGIQDVPQAADEYDEYALRVARMLSDGTSVAELSRHLLEIETDVLGLKGDLARVQRVAAKLLTITQN